MYFQAVNPVLMESVSYIVAASVFPILSITIALILEYQMSLSLYGDPFPSCVRESSPEDILL